MCTRPPLVAPHTSPSRRLRTFPFPVRPAADKKKQVQLTVSEAVGWLVYGIVLYGGADAATDGKPIRTSIAFFNRIARSKAMAAWLRRSRGL